jgi:hypothetical protein
MIACSFAYSLNCEQEEFMCAAAFAKASLGLFSIERHRRRLLSFSLSSIFVVAIVSLLLPFLFVIRAFAIGHER